MESLQHSAELALAAGVPKENIILDPGIGFGKTFSIEILSNCRTSLAGNITNRFHHLNSAVIGLYVIAQAGATCCLMHNKQNTDYHNLVWECMESLQHSAELAS